MPTDAYLRDFGCGLGAAFVTTSITFPINKLIYRQVLGDGRLKNAFESIRKEGPFYLYRGCLPPLLQKTVSITTMFGVNNSAMIALKRYNMNEYLEKISASAASGTLEAGFMPFERVQVLLVHAKYNKRFRNMFHAFKQLRAQYGLKEYYRGFTIIWMRNICSNSCFFITKSELQKLQIMKDKRVKDSVKNFCSGGLLGLIMSTLFYPMKVMKIFAHEKIGGPHYSVFKTAAAVYKQNGGGLKNFYPGVAMNGVRSLLSWGITNMVFEFLKNVA
ncbi:mitochondrial nicotinamide adenine dinucleotide transporter SLC25A51 [Leptinotarsa decemlineata]|uniref:mitochondrial nicotinamide adenine dinucleotide transporter SLC25A51 n=1 Tax=Leptinotarsa decemlineata TaxID=7539 RepID=UPI000C252568|nr:solute carrier family 25 member 51-like [Leptinotarsa decemlineata]